MVRGAGGDAIDLFYFPPDCVTGIIFGCRMLVNLRKEMSEYLNREKQYSHLKKYDAVLDEREFKLNLVPTEI